MAFVAVGEVFKYTPHRTQVTSLSRYSVELRVMASTDCMGCHFKEKNGKCSKPATALSCTAVGRVDRTSVKFVINDSSKTERKAGPVNTPVHRRLSMEDIYEAVSCHQDIPDEILDQMDDV